ncbi:MAG: efflux RND transporter permease subunit [Gemmatimonadetes bacterium]|uniref:Efflux RND transporter permease subunit n=1 Tax=Candidatus Kutchimonas denitrificans TaxID=3056748 RepID=A0AAE5C9Q5_9BACT|nr:efflux RND transporter permease subunit [Gemmatimonadota bacterium]NIR73682.1 efflux RND transporter permease subunit [Candidatus Kutchimonas denitrificans]NIS00732.1 efflux RND transporter permease subunit [Gemmatimonadota bacterium]NIT66319.1 efflux RND transporter permease subunit [Gemmatimonadota bacterium]NIU51537.1 AcrB/AcrD/AcrF family protein [Gemmatimonadota bacterium]
MRSQIAGRLADAFIDSKLTPLLMAGALALGLYTVFTMPSEEEPQIIVPLADIYVPLPGAAPEEVENRVLIPMENIISGIEGVEYVYSHAEPGFGLVTVRYEVGRDMEESLVRLYTTLFKHADRMPPGVTMPLIKTVTIDDVPFFTLTLTGEDHTHADLRAMADELRIALEAVPEVRDIEVIGGYPREIRVELAPDRMAAYGVDPAMIAERLRASNVNMEAGHFTRGDEVVRVTAGPFLRSVRDVGAVVVDVRNGRLVQVSDVARVIDGPEEVTTYTFHARSGASLQPMVTLAVSKRPGADATQLGRTLESKVEALHGRLLPDDVDALVTRNYGETARDKTNTLKEHLLLAIIAVGVVVALTMGWRSAVIVMISVPITFALTLFVYQFFGYTLNRVTLFALIFVTGIVIDDSIIVAENMERHFAMRDRPAGAAARAAVDEVGNPTILATLTVIAAVLPMLFVSGLMGPYMSPMPIGATVAMLFSLAVALIGTPWLAFRLLRHHAEDGEEESGYAVERTRLYRVYRKIMAPLMARPLRMWGMLGAVFVLLLAATAIFLLQGVEMKMLPFDDKNEMQIIVDMPEGTPLETTTALAEDIGRSLAAVPEVSDIQLYAGTAAPFNFNGMIRHYYLRRGPNVADIQVNLIDKSERGDQSHDVALRVRPLVDSAVRASGTGARAKVVEVPPGPPVLSTLVAEVYGPDIESQTEVAREIRDLFEAHPSVVDVDWSLRAPQPEVRLAIDEEKAALSGVPKAAVVHSARIALAGQVVTHLSEPRSRTGVPVRLRVTEADRSGVDRLAGVHVASLSGELVPLGELVRAERATVPQVIDRKNGHRVIYVTAEVAGAVESPVYAILDLNEQIAELERPTGTVGQLYARQPRLVERPVMKWDGEWQVTYEVFRDLGIAFAGALLLIYALIVAWFGSFVAPLVMMTAIPLTLIGIAPGHWLFGAFFTATSMIGMIALAGIMVRNGILLIDYLEARRGAGVALEQAVIEAGAVRTRPIALTAGTVVIGAIVILFDPIFEGLAVALITGAMASTLLTLVVVPSIYYLVHTRGGRRAEAPQAVSTIPSNDPSTSDTGS